MEKSRPAAERIRPFLQAMERSIDLARQRRLHTAPGRGDEPGQPANEETGQDPEQTDPPIRRKARPKRPSHLNDYLSGKPLQPRRD